MVTTIVPYKIKYSNNNNNDDSTQNELEIYASNKMILWNGI